MLFGAESEDFEERGTGGSNDEGEDPAEVLEAGFEAEAEDEGGDEEDEEGFAEDSEEGAGGVHSIDYMEGGGWGRWSL